MTGERDSITNIWGERAPYVGEGCWPVRVDQNVLDEPERWVPSCCVLCSNGCGLDIGVREGRIVGVRGRGQDRVNRGRLGPKGLHGWVANNSPDRLTEPLVRRGGRLEPTTWDAAMRLLVDRTRALLDGPGPGAIGFYNTGQLFLEDYYTLSLVARAGVKTNHIDGNTRLCTATAAQALMQSFGSDGDPGSYEDYDTTAAVFLVGHNMAETQTVLWSRLLDRRRGPAPPLLVVVDPRRTRTAAEADLHLRPRVGTNVALLNGIQHLWLRDGHVEEEFIRDHTVGLRELERTVRSYTPERVQEITGVPAKLLREAARLLGSAPTLVSSCLQGVYQSHQATAAAVQVNNLHLLRGLIGKPGSTVFQMNGQPTAQNTRETGCNGELAAFLNWENERHVALLARHWNVEPSDLPHYAPPTHIMQMLRHAEEGSLRMLWVVGTNPAVSLPELSRVRRVLSQGSLFVVAVDAFENETTRLADVVLPAALWGEKTGTFTNADRTVHISHKAVDPPGEARADMDIFADFARRMDFRDKDGAPLVKWSDPESCFEHFKELTRGRLCDYSGLRYVTLSEGSGIQWPCNETHPNGAARLYTDHRFPTSADECEVYGHDLLTGAAVTPDEYKSRDPNGRAFLKACPYVPAPEDTDDEHPFLLTTGRIVFHFHTRTKTGRSAALDHAAPEPVLELNPDDAARLGVLTGDLVEARSRRGAVTVSARVSDVLPGHAFLPFHYGDWDAPDRRGAANEMTLTAWDPVSKQPLFKMAAVSLKRVARGAVPLDMPEAATTTERS